MADGLSARELSALFKEHDGSWEAAIEARPDLADEIRDWQGWSKQFAENVLPKMAGTAEMARVLGSLDARVLLDPRPLEENLVIPSPRDKFERDVRVFGTALERNARKQAKLNKPPAEDGAPRQLSEKEKRLHNQIPKRAFAEVLTHLVQTENLSEIARATKVDRHDVGKIRDWLNGVGGYEVQPGQLSNTVILVKRR